MKRSPTKPPAHVAELKEREAAGLWQAIALSRKLAESRAPISLESVKEVHRILLHEADPHAAGRFRRNGEDVKKLTCIEPPPGRVVEEHMVACWQNFEHRLEAIAPIPPSDEKAYEAWLEATFDLAAWTQYQITAVHPFCEGNGRMARLLTNMVLMRFGLPPSRVKIEGENKDRYLKGLCQIDKYNAYEPLKYIILEGALETLRKEEKRRQEAQQA